ncbi:MAG: DUF262 domain-containing protein [Phycicoccus sp.]|nr:DUF262 domain-containing protein [Phycicoccus sp.]NMM33320.1 DUF262 domain-containing protein [Phycicoccus sp.]
MTNSSVDTSDEPAADAAVPVLDRTLLDEELLDLTDTERAPTQVTYSTQDFDISGLVQRLQRGSMQIPSYGLDDPSIVTAGFQRGFVWTKSQMDRFIESLLLGYPIPGLFLVKQTTNNRMLVLDGQQRLVTLRRFYEGEHNGREFTLDYVGDKYSGKTYATLAEAERLLLDDSFMQATIVIADGSSTLNTAVYQIFERLNSGGTQLTPHEIRVALYAGPFTAYLEELNSYAQWRSIYGGRSVRIRDQEVVLRALAMFLDSGSYGRPLKGFLNDFAERHRVIDPKLKVAGNLFKTACDRLAEGPGRDALRRPGSNQVNAAQAEAVLVGVMRAIKARKLATDLSGVLAELLGSELFTEATSRSTAGVEAVQTRLGVATKSFRR